MNKKILISLIVILIVIGFIFLILGKTSKPEQPLKETISVLQKEVQLIHEEAWGGKISQEEVNERFTVLEGKVTKLINQYGLQKEVNDFVSQQKTAEEMAKQFELQIMTIEIHLAAMAEIDPESAISLREELSGIGGAIYQGEINKEEADEKLTALEGKISDLVAYHGIEDKIDQLIARYAAVRELIEWAEPRFTALKHQLAGIAEYFIQKHRTDTVKEAVQARALQTELMDFSDEIWEGEVSRKEIHDKLSVLENKAAEMITKHDIQVEVDEYIAKIEASLDRVTAISQRISSIQLQLTALELYLSEKEI